MPDQHGRLTEADHEKIRAWWTGRWNEPVTCPVCKTNDWGVGEHVVLLSRHANDAFRPGTPAYMMITVGCKTCAHTMLFNAVHIGIVAPYDPALDTTESLRALTGPDGG
jgi:hypothetical protein